jgi:hypothetical protein
MSRIALAIGVVAVAIVAAALAGGKSPSYEEATSVVTKGGGELSAGERKLSATFGEAVTGSASSTSFALEAGFLPAQGSADRNLWASAQPVPKVIGATGKTALRWASAIEGDFEVLVNGSVIGTGTASADGVVTTEILGADLPEDDFAEVRIRGTSGPDGQGITFRVYNDRTAPIFRDLAMTRVTAQIDRSMAADGTDSVTIEVPGQAPETMPLFPAGGFNYDLPAPGDEVAIEVVNKVGRTVRSSVNLMVGDPPGPPPVSILGRTIFWPTSEGEAEVDFTVTSEDAKGKLTGNGTLRLPGDPTVHVLETLKGKLSKKTGKKGNKFKLALKGAAKTTKPKVIVKGFWVNGEIVNAKVTVSVKKVFKDKWKPVSFTALKDGGNPINVATVNIAGTAEDSRPDAVVAVATGEGDFSGPNPVPFTEALSSASDLASTLTADDDAEPANRREHSVYTEVGW